MTVTTTPRPSSRSSARALAAVELRDHAHDVETETEVRRPRAFAAARTDTIDSNRRSLHALAAAAARRWRPSARASSAVARERDLDRAAGRELDGVRDQLVEHLRDEVGRAVDRSAASAGAANDEGALRIGDAVAVDAAARPRREVEALALDVVEALLEPRGLAHAGEDRVEALEPFLRALDVDARARPAAATP